MMWFAKLKHAFWTKSCLDTKYVTRLFPNLDDYTTNWMGPPRYPTQRSERRIYIRTLDPPAKGENCLSVVLKIEFCAT